MYSQRKLLDECSEYYLSSIEGCKAFQLISVKGTNQQCHLSRWFILGEPLQSAENKVIFKKLRAQGYYFVGISSYVTFPFSYKYTVNISNNDIDDINGIKGIDFFADQVPDNLMGWLNCYRGHDSRYPANLSLMDFSESDIINVESHYNSLSIEKKYDFVYNCQQGKHQRLWRNWSFAIKCIELMVTKYNLKIILVGKKDDPYNPPNEQKILDTPNIIMTSFLAADKLHKYIRESRGLFVPGIFDASPRIAAESLHLNTPILENRNIIGGWHYINQETGVDFDNTLEDFERALNEFLRRSDANEFNARKSIQSKYTSKLSSTRFAKFMNSLEQPLFYANNNIFDQKIQCIICGRISKDEKQRIQDIVSKYRLKVFDYTDTTIFEQQELKKFPLFVTSIDDICTDYSNHYLSLFFDLYDDDDCFNIAITSGTVKEKQSNECLYLVYGQYVDQINSCIINPKYLKEFLEQYNKSDHLICTETLCFEPNIFKGSIESTHFSIRSESDQETDPCMFDSYTYDFTGHGKGIIYEETINQWKEIKNGNLHGTYSLKEKKDDTIILYDNKRELYVKICREGFYVAINKNYNNAVFTRYFDITSEKINKKWIYHGTLSQNYFIHVGNAIWHEFKNNKFWAEFNTEERSKNHLVIYDKSRNLCVKLESKKSTTRVKMDGEKWNFLSIGYWKKYDT